MSIINTFINSKNYSIILTIRDIYVVVRHTVSLTYSSLIQRFAYSTSSNTCNIFWLFCQFHTNAVPQGRRSVLTATYHANIKSGLRGYVTEPPLHLFPDHVDSEIIFDIFCDILWGLHARIALWRLGWSVCGIQGGCLCVSVNSSTKIVVFIINSAKMYYYS